MQNATTTIAPPPPVMPGRNHGGGPALPAPASFDMSHVGFGDVLEAINPLQYVPVVGMIYREITGDDVHPALRIAVSAALSLVFGGPLGLAATMLSTVAGEVLHGGHGHDGPGASATQYAEAARAYHPSRLA